MHDLHAADQILKRALESAAGNNLKKITKIVVELGEVEEHGAIIAPANLKFNLRLLSAETIARGAKILILKIKGDSYGLKEIQGVK